MTNYTKKSILKLQPSSTLVINEKSKKLIAEGKKVYSFGFGQSPFPVPESIIAKLKENAHRKEYLPIQGLVGLRNSISKYLTDASDNDWIIISDIDELPNPDVIQNFNKKKKYSFFKQQLFYYKFNLKCVSEPSWYGSRLCVKRYLKSPQWLRNIKVNDGNNFFKKFFYNHQILKNGGWHFSSVKKPSEIITKLKSFAHNELVKEYMLDENYIKNKIGNYQDIFERNVTLKKVELNKDLPEYLVRNKSKYSEFII